MNKKAQISIELLIIMTIIIIGAIIVGAYYLSQISKNSKAQDTDLDSSMDRAFNDKVNQSVGLIYLKNNLIKCV